MAETESKVIVTAVDNTGAAFRGVKSSLSDLNKHLDGLLGPLVALTGAGGFAALIKNQIDLGDQLSKTSQKLGITVENLSAYQYAAKLSGVSNEDLTGSLAKLGKAVQESLADPSSKAAGALQALGVSQAFVKANANDLGAVFEAVAGKLNTFQDGTAKTTAEMQLFGKSGYHLAPLINGLQELTNEARETGNVISTEFAQQSEKFNDSVQRLEASAGKLGRAIASNVLPALNELIERLNVATGAQSSLGLDLLEKDRAALAIRYQALKQREEGLGFTEAFVAADKAQVIAEIDAIDKLIIAQNKKLLGHQQNEQQKGSNVLNLAADDSRGLDNKNKKRGDDRYEEELQMRGKMTDAVTKEEEQANEKSARERERLQKSIEQLNESFLTEQEMERVHYDSKQMLIDDAYVREIISAEEHKRQKEELEIQHQARMGNVTAQGVLGRRRFEQLNSMQQTQFVLGQLMSLTQGTAAHNKTMFQINKASGIANAVINTALGVTKALSSYPPPLSFAMAAVQLAAGLAQIQQIKSASFGDSSSAPSIGGGSAIPVTSADRVRAPDAIPILPSAQSAAPAPRNVTVMVQSDSGIVTTAWIRDYLFPSINDALGDGVTLNIQK